MNKISLKIKTIIVISLIVILAIGGFIAYGLVKHTAAPEKNLLNTATFDFDSTKAPGWFAGNNISGDSSNTSSTGTKMGTTTRMIAQGTAEQPTGNCFVQLSYYANNSKSPADALSEFKTLNEDNSGMHLEFKTLLDRQMATDTGSTPYQLYQYEIVGGESQKMSRGNEFGFVKAGTGYIDIHAYCSTAEELSITLPVLSAVSFKQK